MADGPMLVCTSGELAGKKIPVPEGGLGIGRSPENTVVIRDEGVSRYHGRLLFDNGSLWLQDAGSRNGVFVNGTRVTGHKALKVGDSITIAQHTFELRWSEEGSEEPKPPKDGSKSEMKSIPPKTSVSSTKPPASVGTPTDQPPEPTTGRPQRRRWFWPFS